MPSLLIVDNNLRDHDRYGAFLGECGLELVCCSSSAEAIQKLDLLGPDLRAALVLWELTDVPTGSELVLLLRRRRPDMPVIVVSGLLDLGRLARAMEFGACDFLRKPLEQERLSTALRAALRCRPEAPLMKDLRERVMGAAPNFLETLEKLAAVIAEPNETVLLLGENGVGKEVLAQAIHDLGAADRSKWMPVNVASIPPPLLESTLFGHEVGAFTDARHRRLGVFEESGSGTLFLDEIGELDFPLQAKLLRVLQERQFRRVGGTEDLQVRARLVCATNRDLVAAKEAGRFREDLYYRIAAHEIRLPPLRERGDDVWLFVDYFLHKHAPRRKVKLARETKEVFATYPFPGNIRELDGILKHALLHCTDELILPSHLPLAVMQQRQRAVPADGSAEEFVWPALLFNYAQKDAVAELEKAFNRWYLARKLKEAGGNLTRAARVVGLDPKTFRKKWEQAGLDPLRGGE